ncbi:MAG: hypothetical protein F6K28_48955 [Microcoleus sp. SIO2G3]|nr:hypothetical protein [Microcoleus sp. SIO2G3]
MSDSYNDAQASRPDPLEEPKNKPLNSEDDPWIDDLDSTDEVSRDTSSPALTAQTDKFSRSSVGRVTPFRRNSTN